MGMGMEQPAAARPFMPGYGTLPADEGTGLLPWSWAEKRLRDSPRYWLATTRPDGRPHVMPVWAVWVDGCVWFSSSVGSRKARNLRANPSCVVTTDDPREPVVVEARAEVVVDPDGIGAMVEVMNRKYEVSYGLDFFDPVVNATYRARPERVFGLREDDFTGSPTRWTFDRP
jgi:PPOX class probable F420-dependent enzyme